MVKENSVVFFVIKKHESEGREESEGQTQVETAFDLKDT